MTTPAEPLVFPILANLGNLQRAMVFVDGENLATRYGVMLEERGPQPRPEIFYRRNAVAWGTLWRSRMSSGLPYIFRTHYYTSIRGDDTAVSTLEGEIKGLGIEAPRVFKRRQDQRRPKGVDISLAVDMLSHAARKNYDIALLIAGDGDFVPLVHAVQREGAIVILWALSGGLNDKLVKAADSFLELDKYFFG